MSLPYSLTHSFGSETPYARSLKQLLPPGKLWNLDSGSELRRVLLAISQEFRRIAGRAAKLVKESDPRTADETIADWERMLGLPDDLVTAIAGTLAERQLAVTQKAVARGGQSSEFFVQLAAACGYTATVSNYNALLARCGRARCGDRTYGVSHAYAMLVTVTAVAFVALDQDAFERVIRHATHSHIQVVFEYP